MNRLFASRLGFIAFSVFIVLSAALAVLAYSYGGVDFGVYYAAGRALLHGGNPYDYAQLSKEIVSVTGKLNNPYYYAPWFTWFALPFSLLSFHTASIVLGCDELCIVDLVSFQHRSFYEVESGGLEALGNVSFGNDYLCLGYLGLGTGGNFDFVPAYAPAVFI